MITVDGYSSLYRFYSDAQFVIRKKLKTVGPEQFAKNGITNEERNENIREAAKHIVLDIFRVGGDGNKKFPKIMTIDGRLLNASPLFLDPPTVLNPVSHLFSKNQLTAADGGLEFNGEYLFGLASLSSDYWHDAFNRERVFYTGPFDVELLGAHGETMVPLIDWETGAISLSSLRHLNDAVEAMRTASINLRMCRSLKAIDDMDSVIEAYDESDSKSLLGMLTPYDNCTIVAPTEWLKYLNLSESESREAQSIQRLDGAPWKAIVNLKEQEPSLTKLKVKARLFPKTSSRQFNSYWIRASELKPEIMKPGRRSTKS